MTTEIARTTITIKGDDGEWDWMQASVTTTRKDGHYTVQTDNIPEDLIPMPRRYRFESKAMREHFRQVQFVREMVEDFTEEGAVEVSTYRQPFARIEDLWLSA